MQKRKLVDPLGPRWSKEEIEHFYELYRKHGKDWKKVTFKHTQLCFMFITYKLTSVVSFKNFHLVCSMETSYKSCDLLVWWLYSNCLLHFSCLVSELIHDSSTLIAIIVSSLWCMLIWSTRWLPEWETDLLKWWRHFTQQIEWVWFSAICHPHTFFLMVYPTLLSW